MDMNKVKNHPAFMAFWGSNVKSDTSDTQSKRDEAQAVKEQASDSKLGK